VRAVVTYGSVVVAEVLPIMLAERVTDAAGDVVVGERAVERDRADSVDQGEDVGDAVAARLGGWDGLGHGRLHVGGRGTAAEVATPGGPANSYVPQHCPGSQACARSMRTPRVKLLLGEQVDRGFGDSASPAARWVVIAPLR
jgi:hypothetical protein